LFFFLFFFCFVFFSLFNYLLLVIFIVVIASLCNMHSLCPVSSFSPPGGPYDLLSQQNGLYLSIADPNYHQLSGYVTRANDTTNWMQWEPLIENSTIASLHSAKQVYFPYAPPGSAGYVGVRNAVSVYPTYLLQLPNGNYAMYTASYDYVGILNGVPQAYYHFYIRCELCLWPSWLASGTGIDIVANIGLATPSLTGLGMLESVLLS
jgi:hypothetical protein